MIANFLRATWYGRDNRELPLRTDGSQIGGTLQLALRIIPGFAGQLGALAHRVERPPATTVCVDMAIRDRLRYARYRVTHQLRCERTVGLLEGAVCLAF